MWNSSTGRHVPSGSHLPVKGSCRCASRLSTGLTRLSGRRSTQEVQRVGVVRIGFAGSLATATVASLARSVRELYPGIELRITASHSSSGIMDLLQADRLDVGFTGTQRSVPGISTRLIRSEPLGVLVASDHPLAGTQTVTLAQLAEEAFVLTDLQAGLQLREQAIEACLDAGFRPRVVQEAPDTLTVMALVAAGVGITVVPSRFAEESSGGPGLPRSVGRGKVSFDPGGLAFIPGVRCAGPGPGGHRTADALACLRLVSY